MTRRARISFICLVGFLLPLLTGCVELTYHATVNKDGSLDLEYTYAATRAPLAELRQKAERDGFTVTDYTSDGLVGIRARKHFASPPEDLMLPEEFSKAIGSTGKPIVSIKKGIFHTTYNASADVDLSWGSSSTGQAQLEDEFAPFGEVLGDAMVSQIKIRVLVTLPCKPLQHNATQASKDGKTLEWRLIPGRKNRLELRARVPNFRNVALLIALTAAVMAGATGLLRKRRRRAARESIEDGSTHVGLDR